MNKIDKIHSCLEKLNAITNDSKKSFDYIINYFAYNLGIPNSVCSGTMEIFNILRNNINVEEYIDDSYEDFIGTIYEKIYNIKLVPFDVIEKNMELDKVKEMNENSNYKRMQVSNADTGRVLLYICKNFSKYKSKMLFFCTTSELIKYKILLINCSLYKINAKVLYKEINKEYKVDINDFNDDFCNKWI